MAQIDVNMDGLIPENDQIIKRFTSLWFACYFENKLTKNKVTEVDLPIIIKEMIASFGSEDNTLNFRKATPLLIGLHNLFVKRLNFLIRDSQNVLKEMTEPITLVTENASSVANTRSNNAPSGQVRQNNFKLNPKHFEWFLDGIDKV